MAVKPCKDCGGPVSDRAESCPQCGAKQKKKTSIFVWIVVGVLALAGIGAALDKTVEDRNSDASGSSEGQAAISAENVVEQNWTYETSTDEMRGIDSRFATVISTNTIDFDFPYNGGSKLMLTLRKRGSEVDVMVAVTKGQFLCGARDCEAAFKFDEGEVQSITMVEPDSHSSDLLFVSYDNTENKIISQLKKSQRLVVEVPFYKEGKKQFTFDVSGLEWN